jgi:hypothetical protein
MPVDIVIDTQSGLVRATIENPTSAGEFIAGFKDMLGHPDFHPGMKVLVDMLRYVHVTTGADMRRVAQTFVQSADAVSGMDVAVVVSTPVSYGVIRMLQVFVEGSPFRINVFYDMEEAKRHLGVA